MNYKFKKFVSIIFFFFLIIFGFKPPFKSLVFAQNPEFQPKINPLQIKEKDPLLPSIDRPLTDFEQKRLKTALDELDQEANNELKSGNEDQAFNIWYRELRLRRVFGTEEEIKGLIKIGAIAWEKGRNQDINNINQRLLTIEAENNTEKGEISQELLLILAEAYQTVHNLDKSIEIEQKILNELRIEEDKNQIYLSLDRLGTFYLAKFNYYQAEPIYQELLIISREKEDYLKEGIYLRKLAEINTEIAKPENSVNYKEQLAENQLTNQEITSLADLKIAIADDYKLLNKPEDASKYYQEAFALAWSLQQFATAGDALKKLGRLYEENNQNEYALQIYQELIKIEQQSYNLYGLMNTYDAIARVYLKEQNYSDSLKWLEKAREIAYHLKYKQDYFNTQIQQVNQQLNPPPQENEID